MRDQGLDYHHRRVVEELECGRRTPCHEAARAHYRLARLHLDRLCDGHPLAQAAE